MTRTLLLILLLAFLAPSVPADPPDWAPAHGWRKKHGRDEDDDDGRKHKRTRHREESRVGYEGKRWPSDYGILRSHCNREMVGAVLGGVVGGAVGAKVGREEDRAVATVIGSVIGAVIGAQIGRSMDERDRACVGHALELAADGRAVQWNNELTGAQYLLSPTREFVQGGKNCREFTLEVTLSGRQDASRQQACRDDEGVWVMQAR